jgi:hypothetical protein
LFWVAVDPQLLGNRQRIDLTLLPPSSFITCGVIFAVVDCTQRHGEFIAHFERDSLRLSVANMVRLGGGTTTNQAWLRGN